MTMEISALSSSTRADVCGEHHEKTSEIDRHFLSTPAYAGNTIDRVWRHENLSFNPRVSGKTERHERPQIIPAFNPPR